MAKAIEIFLIIITHFQSSNIAHMSIEVLDLYFDK